MTTTTTRFALVLLILTASASTSRADDLVWGSAYQNPWSSWDAYQYKRVEQQVRDKYEAARDADEPSAVEHRPLSATDFKPAKHGGRPAVDQYIASTGLTGAQADEFRGALAGALAEIERQVRKNNVATSMGVLIAASTYVVNGVELDDATQDNLIANLNDVLAADPSFKKLKARDRQLMSDAMMVQTAVILMLASSGQTDPVAKQASETLGRSALKLLTGSETGK